MSQRFRGTSVDFSTVELSAEDEAFRTEVREFLSSVVTEDVIRHELVARIVAAYEGLPQKPATGKS